MPSSLTRRGQSWPRPYYRTVYAGTVETAGLPAQTYPVVVCADVLEHTVDPVAVLRQLQLAATPEATFIVSLPNVAHLAARLLLLLGRFPQMEFMGGQLWGWEQA